MPSENNDKNQLDHIPVKNILYLNDTDSSMKNIKETHYLMKSKSQNMTKCQFVCYIIFEKWNVEWLLFWAALKGFEHDVQHPIRIQVKTACKQSYIMTHNGPSACWPV